MTTLTPTTIAPALRPYQEAALASVEAARELGHPRVTVALPPGTGKTRLFTAYLRSHGGRALILAHRRELLIQAGTAVLQNWPELEPDDLVSFYGFVAEGGTARAARVVLASTQTVLIPGNARALGDFDTVIVDEAHHYTAEQWRQVFTFWPKAFVLCVTGTPLRGDGVWAPDGIGPVVYAMTTLEAMEGGYLTDLLDYAVQTKPTAGEIAKMTSWCQDNYHGITLVYCQNVTLAREVAHLVRYQYDEPCEALDCDTDPDIRERSMERLRAGTLRVVTNVGLFTEGVDLPATNSIVLAASVGSSQRMGQMVGRVMRRAPDKQYGMVVRMGVKDWHRLSATDGFLGPNLPWLKEATVHKRQSVLAALRKYRSGWWGGMRSERLERDTARWQDQALWHGGV